MLVQRRRNGSQRSMKALTLVPVFDPSSLTETPSIVFRGSDGVYYTCTPRNEEEMKKLHSWVCSMRHYWPEDTK